jgi:phosphoenolpyruvate synthase/pyruvate phosphate dikinase
MSVRNTYVVPLEDVQRSDTPRVGGKAAALGALSLAPTPWPPAEPLPDLSPGDVLVAQNVGPRWTPIFPILGGLVLDGGSLGQHAAAAAREYAVPAVIGARDATRRIPDGDWVTVDGTAGTVSF